MIPESRPWVIYLLRCPRTGSVRYVGFTSQKVSARIRRHKQEALRGNRNHRSTWLFSLLSMGLAPLVEIVEHGRGIGWQEAERRWIKHFRAAGANLVNGTDGGDGKPGHKSNKSPEERSALARRIWETRSPEERKRWAAKISALGKAHQAQRSKEERLATARRVADARSPERRSEIVRKQHATEGPEVIAERMAKMRARLYQTTTPEQRKEMARQRGLKGSASRWGTKA